MASAAESEPVDEDASPVDADSDDDADASETARGTDEPRTTADVDDRRYTRKKCVLITGCSSGIGRATAKAFLEEEWLVVATARNPDDVADLAEAGCETMALDVTKPDQVATAVEETVELGGAIDCLVNNAGFAQFGPIEDVSTSDLHRQFDVNVYGPHRLTRAVLPHMRAQGDGRIVNVSSVYGRLSTPGVGAYAGSKFALEAMSDALRGEAEEFGIDVTLVEPGTVETNFHDRSTDELPRKRTPAYEALYELIDDVILVSASGPLAVTPEDVARAILESATCAEPPARYPVGPIAQFGGYARFLPDRLRDATYGLLRRLV